MAWPRTRWTKRPSPKFFKSKVARRIIRLLSISRALKWQKRWRHGVARPGGKIGAGILARSTDNRAAVRKENSRHRHGRRQDGRGALAGSSVYSSGDSRMRISARRPSANLSGRVSPTNAEHVHRQLGDKISLIVDGGQSQVGIESAVLDLTVSPPQVLASGDDSCRISRRRLRQSQGPGSGFKVQKPRCAVRVCWNGITRQKRGCWFWAGTPMPI